MKAQEVDMTIYKTEDYNIFNFLGGNRNVNLKNANKIIISMKKNFIINPIIVNENYEIIDGQHRFYAEKELGLPVYYIMNKGLGLKECQELNSNSKTWSSSDFLNGYCELGYVDYLKLKKFKEKNKHLSLQLCELMLADNVNIGTALNERFKTGKYKVISEEKAQKYADMLKDFEGYPPYGQKLFFMALLKIFDNKGYNHERMLNKLAFQNSRLQKEVSILEYQQLLCDIYNYKTKLQDKLILEYKGYSRTEYK